MLSIQYIYMHYLYVSALSTCERKLKAKSVRSYGRVSKIILRVLKNVLR